MVITGIEHLFSINKLTSKNNTLSLDIKSHSALFRTETRPGVGQLSPRLALNEPEPRLEKQSQGLWLQTVLFQQSSKRRNGEDRGMQMVSLVA